MERIITPGVFWSAGSWNLPGTGHHEITGLSEYNAQNDRGH